MRDLQPCQLRQGLQEQSHRQAKERQEESKEMKKVSSNLRLPKHKKQKCMFCKEEMLLERKGDYPHQYYTSRHECSDPVAIKMKKALQEMNQKFNQHFFGKKRS